MGAPVVVVPSGGLPVVVSTNGFGVPFTIATNGFGRAITQAINGIGLPVVGVTFGPDVTAPIITSATAVSNLETTVLAHTLTANEPVTWTLVGGVDQARFELSGSTLRWLTNGTKTYASPNDSDANNTYIVQVRATDLASNPSTAQTITVTVQVATPLAPTLTLTSGTSDNTPDFTLTGDLRLNDTVRFQYSTASDFTGAPELTNAIDAGEDAANTIGFTTGALADNTWYFRARIERPGAVAAGAWSNTVTDTIVAPLYTGPGDIVSGATAYWGLRAYSGAYAAAGSPCCDLGQNTDGLFPVTINFTASGYVDTTAVAAALAANKSKVMKLYDHVGTNHLVPIDHNAAPRLQSNTGPGGTTLAMYNDGASAGDEDLLRSAAITLPQPYSYLFLAKSKTGMTGQRGFTGSLNPLLYIALWFDGNMVVNSGGTSAVGTVFSIGNWHATSAAITNASSGTGAFNTDSTATSCTGIGTVGYVTEQLGVGGSPGLGSLWDGWICEFGIWPMGFNSTQQTNLNSNMHTRWAF